MPNEDNKILKYNHGQNSLKVPFIIYADLEPLLEKISTCHNNSEKPSTTKTYTLWLFIVCTCSFDLLKSMLDCYRGKDCMERFFKDLKQHATKIIIHEQKRNDTIN